MKSRTSTVNIRDKKFYNIFFLILLAALVLSTIYTRYNPFEIFFRGEAFWVFLREDFMPPTIRNPAAVISAIGVTIALAIVATTVAAIMAFLSAVFISTRTAPFLRFAKLIRGIVTMIRNIPSLIWAFILFSALGVGVGVALIALTISSYGFLARTFVEVIDELPPNSLEAMTACGCTFGQKIIHCVLPTCMLGFIEWFLFSIEINIRSSTIVGMVGGGGIGLVLFTFIRSFNYSAAAGVILIIVAMVVIVEWGMSILKRKLYV